MIVKPKAIYVGPSVVGTKLAEYQNNWDFTFVDNISKLWEGLGNETIDSDVQAVVTVDVLFDPTGGDQSFEQLVASLSPYCMFMVVQYKPDLEPVIRERISTMAGVMGQPESEFYFIKVKGARQSIEKAVSRYTLSSDNRRNVAILEGRDPDEMVDGDEVSEVEPAAVEQDYYNSFDDVNSDYMGRVVAVTSSKGGSGKSTVAISLATYLAHASENSVYEGLEDRPLKVVVLDLDVRDGQIGFLTGNLKPSVLNLRSKGITEMVLAETAIHSERLKVDLLLAPKRPRLSEDTPPEFYLELIQFLKRHYDYIILDTSVNYLDPLLENVAYPIADFIVFVTDIVVSSVYSMTRWVQEVVRPKEHQGMGIPINKIGIVLNKAIANVSMEPERLATSAQGVKIITVIPNSAKLIAHATNLQTMESILRHPEIYKSVRRLARAISGKSYNLSDNLFRK